MIENDEHTYSLNDERYLRIDIINFIYWSLNLRKLKMCHLNGLVEIWYLIFNSINPYMKQSWTYVARKKILIVLVPSWQKNWRWNVIIDVDCDETKYDAQNLKNPRKLDNIWFSRITRFWNNLHRVKKIGKSNNLEFFERTKSKDLNRIAKIYKHWLLECLNFHMC